MPRIEIFVLIMGMERPRQAQGRLTLSCDVYAHGKPQANCILLFTLNRS